MLTLPLVIAMGMRICNAHTDRAPEFMEFPRFATHVSGVLVL